MPSVGEIRRENLRKFAEKEGSISALADKLGKSQPQVSQLIGKNPTRGIGAELAREFEKKLHLNEYDLDKDFDQENINILDNADLVYIKCIDVQQSEKEGALMFLEDRKTVPVFGKSLEKANVNKEDCVALVVEDDLMLPFASPKDNLGFDLKRTHVENGAVYLINMYGKFVVRRLYKEYDGRVKVVCDNEYQKKKAPDTIFDLNTPNCGLEIVGRAFFTVKFFE